MVAKIGFDAEENGPLQVLGAKNGSSGDELNSSGDEWTSSQYRHTKLLRDFQVESSLARIGMAEGECVFGHCVVAGEGEAPDSLNVTDDTLLRVGTVGVALKVGGIPI